MSKGAFENPGRNKTSVGSSASGEQEKPVVRRKRRKRRKQNLRIPVLAVVAVLVLTVVISMVLMQGNPLIGRWDMDEVTSYEFRKGGKGSMILPDNEYAFTYKIKDHTVYIDFEREGIKDSQYSFELAGGALTFSGGNNTNQGTHILTRSESN